MIRPFNKNTKIKNNTKVAILRDLARRIFTPLVRIYAFYVQGFRAMKLGKTLWGLIAIKLFVIFVVLKMFVFDSNLNTRFADDSAKSDFVLMNLTK